MKSLYFFYSVLNFMILVFLLRLLLKKKIDKFLLDRKNSYISKKEESQTLYNSSAEELNKIKVKLKNVDLEGKNYLDRTIDQSNREAGLVLKKVMNIRDQIVVSRQRLVNADIKDFKKLVRSRIANKILERTEGKIQTKTPKGLNEMYIDEYSEISKPDMVIK